jgi:hypothetical protein
MANKPRVSQRIYATNADRQRAYRLRQLKDFWKDTLIRMACSDREVADWQTIRALKRRGLVTERVAWKEWTFQWVLTDRGFDLANELRRAAVIGPGLRTYVRSAAAVPSPPHRSGRKSAGSSRARSVTK